MISDETDEIIKKLFNPHKNWYQNNLQSMGSSQFVFDYVHLLYYKCNKVNLNRDGLYINSPDWIKNKKATVSPINKKDSNSFEWVITVGLIYDEMGKQAERITKIKFFINNYNWKEIICQPENDDWKKVEKINAKIAPNGFYAKYIYIYIYIYIYLSYVSKHNSNREKLVMFLIISNGEKVCEAKSEGWWHYLGVKKLLALLRGITSKHHGYFYCLNCLNFFATEKKIQSHKRVCENKDICNIIMPPEGTKIL